MALLNITKKALNNKEKIPSQFNDLLSHSNINNGLLFINLLFKKCCGRAENRTRNFQLTAECFTTKLLAHNQDEKSINYLNVFTT